MMRVLLAAVMVAVGSVGATASEIDNLLMSCDFAAEGSYCASNQAQFKEEWPKANRGDYGAQRNVAFCMKTSCDGAVQVDVVAACAWRTVIVASDAAWNSLDMTSYQQDCQGVKADGAAMARLLFRKIYKRRMPAID